MNRRMFRLFYFIIPIFFISSCSHLNFSASNKTPIKIKADEHSKQLVEINSTNDFYFWGLSPATSTIDLEEQSRLLGLEYSSAVTIEQSISFSNMLYTLVTLGLYCPVDIKISMMAKKQELQQ